MTGNGRIAALVYAAWMSLRNRFVTGFLVLTLLVTGLWRLRLETEVFSLLPKHLREVQGLLQLHEHFVQRDELIVSIEGPSSAETQSAVSSLAEHLGKQSLLVKSARWSGVFENGETASALLAWALQNAPPERLKMIKERMEPTQIAPYLQSVLESLASSPDAALVQRRSYDPLGLMDALDLAAAGGFDTSGFSLASEDGRMRLLFVEPKEPLHGYKHATKWLTELRAVIEEWQKTIPSKVVVRFTGEPAFLSETGEGMEHDMSGTIGLTTGLIGLLFWIMHRRMKPLIWIMGLLLLTILMTLATAGLILGKISVMSMGFAPIVLGLVVEYAVLIYQAATDQPQLNSRELRRQVTPGILAAAGTTVAVFVASIFSSFPGLSEMGLLVAVGVTLGSLMMLLVFPILSSDFIKRSKENASLKTVKKWPAVFSTILLITVLIVVIANRGWSGFDGSSAAIRPRHSEAMDAFEHLQKRVGKTDEASVTLLMSAPDSDFAKTAQAAEALLSNAKKDGVIRSYTLPTLAASNPEAQRKNRPVIDWITSEQPRLMQAVIDAGFTDDALQLFRGVIKHWCESLAGKAWPQPSSLHPASEVLNRFLSDKQPGQTVMLGSVAFDGLPGTPDMTKLHDLEARLASAPTLYIAGWESLGPAMSKAVQHDLLTQSLPLALVLGAMIWAVFRNGKDFILSIVMLLVSLAVLVAGMTLMNQKWNLASLTAIPLLLGPGIDYGIYILIAMRQEKNDIAKVRATTGRAVFYCGASSIIGFASNLMANNQGVFSLGLACSLGLLAAMTLSLWLLPHWRLWWSKNDDF